MLPLTDSAYSEGVGLSVPTALKKIHYLWYISIFCYEQLFLIFF